MYELLEEICLPFLISNSYGELYEKTPLYNERNTK